MCIRDSFKWVRYHRLYLFIEPYHTPYTYKHRYWTGLLLLVRVILYIATALNVSGAPGVNLLVTGVVVLSLLLLKERLYGPIYRELSVDFLEATCYINIIVFSFASFYTLEAKIDQTVVAYISGTIIVALFLAILACHIFIETCFKTNLWNKLKQKRPSVNMDGVSLIDYQQAEGNLGHLSQPIVSVSWIDAPQREQLLTGQAEVRGNESETNKETPLIGEERQ